MRVMTALLNLTVTLLKMLYFGSDASTAHDSCTVMTALLNLTVTLLKMLYFGSDASTAHDSCTVMTALLNLTVTLLKMLSQQSYNSNTIHTKKRIEILCNK